MTSRIRFTVMVGDPTNAASLACFGIFMEESLATKLRDILIAKGTLESWVQVVAVRPEKTGQKVMEHCLRTRPLDYPTALSPAAAEPERHAVTAEAPRTQERTTYTRIKPGDIVAVEMVGGRPRATSSRVPKRALWLEVKGVRRIAGGVKIDVLEPQGVSGVTNGRIVSLPASAAHAAITRQGS